MAPPIFKGSPKPSEALNWLKEMERTFVTLDFIDQEKVHFVAYQQQGEAYEWWEPMKRQHKMHKNYLELGTQDIFC